jgi:electron transfer flavoprotein-quinone oxidoreductase
MTLSQYDVLVVGAGCAGLTAAIGLARAGFAVAVVEAAPFPGAANWSGGVCFTESLAHPDILGLEGVEALAWERRLVERGRFVSDGHGLLGMTYRDPEAFRHCFTVLRPIFDHHLAQVARGLGVVLLSGTTVESLIRERGRIVGVCTQRGPLYADLVFLAEGDAAHLVSREGYERSSDPRDAPRFLYGIKQVFDLPPGQVEERFGLGPEEGTAYEVSLRNGRLGGRTVRLNLTAFVCTNRQGLSVGLVLPAEHLRLHFGGEPLHLLDWVEGLPALRPWWQGGRRGTCGAKLLRGGSSRDVPHLIDEGLAIGGAASGIAVRFPALNYTGPATATGLLLTQAAVRIRAEGGSFSREELRRHYLEPLQASSYWQDVEFLRRWPGHVRKTRVFFDGGMDLVLGSAYVWTRPRRWLPARLIHWLRLLMHLGGPSRWAEFRDDLLQIGWALHLRKIAARPGPGRLLLDGALNGLRDLLRRPRVGLPPGGLLRLHYHSAGGNDRDGLPPALLRRWFERARPVLAAAARILYRGDGERLSARLTAVAHLLVRQLNLFDLLAASALGLLTAGVTLTLAGLGRLLRRLGLGRKEPARGTLYHDYFTATARTTDLAGPAGDADDPASQHVPAPYRVGRRPFLHLLWPRSLPDYQVLAAQGPAAVCPAGVFETRGRLPGPLQIDVHPERCIQCEACWRLSPLVDWGRDGGQQVLYPVAAPAAEKVLETADWAGLVRPTLPRTLDPWAARISELERLGKSDAGPEETRAALLVLLDRLERRLNEFDAALAKDPEPERPSAPATGREAMTVDRAHADYLEVLARHAQQLAQEFLALLEVGPGPGGPETLALAAALVARTEEQARHTWEGRFAWASADGRQIRQHHLTGLRRLLSWHEPALASPGRAVTGRERLPPGDPELQAAAALMDRLGQDVLGRAAPLLRVGAAVDMGGSAASGRVAAVRRLAAEIAAHRYLLDTLAHVGPPGEGEEGTERSRLLRATATEVLLGGAVRVGRLAAVLGVAPDAETLGRARVKPAVWPGAVYREVGQHLLDEWEAIPKLFALPGDFETLARHRALTAELEELQRAEARLAALAREWNERAEWYPGGSGEAGAEVAEGLGRQAARVLAGKQLLLGTHAQLEEGLDAETEIVLLRVWLDESAGGLDALNGLVHRRLQPPRPDDRPLVEPGSGPPPAHLADYLAAPDAYQPGDFLLAAVDLVQPRPVPEMLAAEPSTPENSPEVSELLERIRATTRCQPTSGEPLPDWMAWRLQQLEEVAFIAESLAAEVIGRRAHPHAPSLELEAASAGLVLTHLAHESEELVEEACSDGAERAELPSSQRAAVLEAIARVVLPRWTSGRPGPAARHLGRGVLELEAVKAAWRQRLGSASEVFAPGRWQNPNVQASCFALAESAGWLKAADSVLGRLAWLERTASIEEEPTPLREVGQRALARCLAEARDRLRRFEEDLALLRRGYYAPHARAALLLERPTPRTAPPPPPVLSHTLSILVVIEPLEALWALGTADQAALEAALRLRDAAPRLVRVSVAAAGPPSTGPILREVLALGVEQVYLAVGDTAVSAATRAEALARVLKGKGTFDLVLAGARTGDLAGLVARALEIHPLKRPLAGAEVVALAGGGALPLPALVAVEPGTDLRSFTIAGYLAGLAREIEVVRP